MSTTPMNSRHSPILSPGIRAPDFSLRSAPDQLMSLGDFRGHSSENKSESRRDVVDVLTPSLTSGVANKEVNVGRS